VRVLGLARIAAAALPALLAACQSGPPATAVTAAPAPEPNTASVTALLDLSGPRAPSGQPQRNAMQLWLDQQRGGPKLNVRFVDVAGSEAKLYIELRRAVVEDRADAIVIGVPVAIDATLAQALQVASVPVLLTLPVSEPAATAGGRFTFALAPTPQMLAKAMAADVIARGRLMPMLIAGDDSSASIVERNAFTAELRRLGVTPPTPVVITQADGTTRVRSAAAVARSVVLAGAAAPFTDAIRAMPAGVDAPRVYLSYLTETADLTALRDQQAIVTWPGASVIGTATAGAGGSFVAGYSARHGPPSSAAATAFDALSLIHAAAEAAPNEHDGDRLRLRVEQLTFAGVVTRYSFTSFRHAGFFSADDLAFLEWSGARPVFAPPARPVTQ
jgi:ABC-type branched-subunit amino acid transport system substrate-binding protein